MKKHLAAMLMAAVFLVGLVTFQTIVFQVTDQDTSPAVIASHDHALAPQTIAYIVHDKGFASAGALVAQDHAWGLTTSPPIILDAAAETSTGQNILYLEYTEQLLMIGAATGSTFPDVNFVETGPPITIAMAETPGEHRIGISWAAVSLVDTKFASQATSMPATGPSC